MASLSVQPFEKCFKIFSYDWENITNRCLLQHWKWCFELLKIFLYLLKLWEKKRQKYIEYIILSLQSQINLRSYTSHLYYTEWMQKYNTKMCVFLFLYFTRLIAKNRTEVYPIEYRNNRWTHSNCYTKNYYYIAKNCQLCFSQ